MEVQSWYQNFHSASPKSESLVSPPRTSSSCSITSTEMQTISTTYEQMSSSSSPEMSFSLRISSSHGHTNQALAAAVQLPSPQISYLAVHDNNLYAASLNQISVFDLRNYTLIDTFSCKNPASGLVKSIAFIDRKIFTAHQDCKIRVWQVTESKKHHLVSTLPIVKDRLRRCISAKNYVQVRRHKQKLWIEHADAVSGLAINDRLVYSISWDKSFKIWRMSDLCCLESIKAHSDAINAIVVSPSGIVYTASADGSIKVWEKPNGDQKKHTLLTALDKHNSSVNALVLNNDGSVLFSGGCDKNILVWERDNTDNHMMLTSSLSGHKGAILCLIYVDDLLISGSSDRTVRIWKNIKDCGYCCMVVLEGHSKPVKSVVAISSRNCNGFVSIFSGSLDGEIKIWQVDVTNFNRKPSIMKESKQILLESTYI